MTDKVEPELDLEVQLNQDEFDKDRWIRVAWITCLFIAIISVAVFAVMETLYATRNPQVITRVDSNALIRAGDGWNKQRKSFDLNNPSDEIPGQQLSPSLQGLTCEVFTDNKTAVTFACHA